MAAVGGFDGQFEYRYSVLIFVFGNLIRSGRLSEGDLRGLSEDKLSSIRRFAANDYNGNMATKVDSTETTQYFWGS